MRGESGFLDAPLPGVRWKLRYSYATGLRNWTNEGHDLKAASANYEPQGDAPPEPSSKVGSGSLRSMSRASLASAGRKRKLQPLLSPEQKSELSLTLCAPILMEHVPKKLHGTL
jgi:hypothetical protein